MKRINKEEKDTSKIKVVKEGKWLQHSIKLWKSLEEAEYNMEESMKPTK